MNQLVSSLKQLLSRKLLKLLLHLRLTIHKLQLLRKKQKRSHLLRLRVRRKLRAVRQRTRRKSQEAGSAACSVAKGSEQIGRDITKTHIIALTTNYI